MFNYYYRQCPAGHYSYTIQPGNTIYQIAQAYGVSPGSIAAANPGMNPNYLQAGQQICIPSPGGASDVYGIRETLTAMQSDINMLKADSNVQQTEEANYGSSTQKTRVISVSNREIRFEEVPVAFSGNFRGHYTAGRSYPYYLDAAMGGQRGITVKDNFGVWHSFSYQVETPQSS